MTLENSIRDAVAQKMSDGTVEKLVAEQLEKGVKNALDHLFGSYGDVTKEIEQQVKSVMVPYIEGYDFSQYLTKLDGVLVDVLKKTTFDNTAILKNFKQLLLPEDRKEIKASELFEIWCQYVAKKVETNGLKVQWDDGVSYEPVDVSLNVNYDDDRDWSTFDYATLTLECEHDQDMNFAIRINRWKKEKAEAWDMTYDSVKDLRSLRHLNEFEILLMRLSQAGTKLIMDTDSESDEITPEKEPEATYE
jgi:hypothetical protein